MVGWHHQLNGYEFDQASAEGQRSLACCSPWGCKELDMTERLNNNFHTIKYTQNNFSTLHVYLLPCSKSHAFVVKILVLCALMPNRYTEIVMEEKERVA